MQPVSSERVPRATRDVTARGVRMRVLEAGLADGPPLILIHGFLANHLEFDDIIDPLARRFRVLAPDLPGFGESEKPNPARHQYGIESFAEAIADLIAAYGLGRAFVVGHGMGGAVGITLTANCAELVPRLIVIDPICYPFPIRFKTRLALLPVVGGVIFKQLYGRRSFRRYFHDTVYGPSASIPFARTDQFYEHFNTPSGRESAFAVLKSMLDTRPVVARVTRIRQPTLVVWGRDDRIIPAAFALKLAREIPEARLELMDTGHSPHEERPREFVAAATEFFEGRR